MTITALNLYSATEKIPTSKIQSTRHYPSERAVEDASPYNSELRQVLSNGRPQVAPTMFRATSYRRKIAPLFADLHLIRDRVGGADFVLRYYFIIVHNFCVLFLLQSAPSRLTPNEALPQTPQGTLSLDPASPLTPGLSLRFISRYARW